MENVECNGAYFHEKKSDFLFNFVFQALFVEKKNFSVYLLVVDRYMRHKEVHTDILKKNNETLHKNTTRCKKQLVRTLSG